LMREGTAYGAIFLWRREPGLFSSSQVALVETFAQQVAIAVDNVRLFKQTKVALERQTATSEILRVISQSQSDVQPVFDTIAKAALELCRASSANVFTIDGELIQLAAIVVSNPEVVEVVHRAYPRPLSRDIAAGRAVLTRNIAAIPDVLEDPEYGARDTAIAAGFRSVLAVPLIRDGSAIGAVAVGKANPGPFPDEQVALLQTFADQAVIAIENVRLFDELQSRTRELSESLQQQTATADVLKVISRSAFDLQKVLDTLAESACKLCDSEGANIWRPDGDGFKVAALFGQLAAQKAALRGRVIKPGNSTCVGRALLERRTVHIPDTDADPEYTAPNVAGNRAMVGVPLLRGGAPIGVLVLTRTVPRPFTEQQIALATTFADQAVIAIENVRLFNETKEALEQQTATSEILRVISQSQTDTQPVFDTIAKAALKLCTANNAMLATYDGSLVRLVAMANVSPKGADALRNIFPRPPSRETTTARAILNRDVVVIPDVLTDPDYRVQANAVASGFRSVLSVPLMHGQEAIGALTVGRPVPGNFKEKEIALLQTFADQAVIAIENVRLFDEVQARTRDLSESLQQQTATADVLKVISRSAFDLQKVLDTLTESACKLCDAEGATIWRPVGDGFKMAAMFGQSPEDGAALKQIVNKPGRATCVGRALLEGRTVHIRDAMADPEYNAPGILAVRGNRAMIGVPLLREGAPIGVLVLTRTVARPFTEQQIALATTFADQAVIAIENVRLFNETKEALEQQTATSEILRVISSSPTDIRPVLDTVAECAARLCGSSDVAIFRRDGDRLRLVAHHGQIPTSVPVGEFTLPLVHASVNGRAMLSGQAVHIADVQAETKEFPVTSEIARQQGSRTWLSVPMLREGVAIGTINLRRTTVELFTERQVALLQTFADQAVIAIENVRLFNETKEALEKQTATSEILRVISQSQTDAQPVFDTIVSAALKLCSASSSIVLTFDGELIHVAAVVTLTQEGTEAIRRIWPRPPSRDVGAARAVLTCSTVAIPDVLKDPDYVVSAAAVTGGFRSTLAVPLVREGKPIGAIAVGRPEPGPFPDEQVALLKIFADQAVIAIENVRLFKELEARTEALTRSVGQLTALGEVGQAVSSTLELETVLKTIVSWAVHLTGLDGGSIYEYDERAEEFRLQAAENMSDDIADDIRNAPTRKGDGALGRTAITLEPTQVPDTLDDSYQSVRKELLIRAGYRALLAVPLLREDRLLGGLLVNRNAPGEFAPEVVELLKTFATQSALAIQNARLFREIAEKGRQLEAASRHKSDFLASMSHELRTPLNAILGFNEMILGEIYGDVPASMKEPLADIQTSGKHLLRLINNVLDLAKIEAGRMELALADYSAQDTVESVRATLRPLAADKGLEFVATVPADLPLAYGDSGRITQCLMNLAGNSLKFTKAGKVEISVEARGDLLVYKVADTGIGIPPDKLDTVFAEFKQTDATIASEYGGTGLGLSISRKFIEMHGGRIWVESELGRGSTFIFEIPLRVSTGAPA
jgi:GAF domain-containing protein